MSLMIECIRLLPSGDEQPMSISRGNNKLNELDARYQEVFAAETAVSDLRVWLKKLQQEAKAVPRSRATAKTRIKPPSVSNRLNPDKPESSHRRLPFSGDI